MKFDMSELSTHSLKVTLVMAKQGQKYKAGIDSAVRAVKMVEDEIARREASLLATAINWEESLYE